MAEADWGDEGSAERPRKKRIPSWVWWGCGGGCLFLTLIVIALVVMGARLFKESTDPEKQWPRLAEVLAYDQRPAGIEIEFGLGIGADQFHLVDREKCLRATLIEYPSSASSEYDRLMDPDFELPMGLGQLVEPVSGKLVVQGREVPCLRFSRVKPEPAEQGAGIRIDLTGTRKKPRTLELRRYEGPVLDIRRSDQRTSEDPSTVEPRRRDRAQPIEDAEVEAFLAPFDVWREP